MPQPAPRDTVTGARRDRRAGAFDRCVDDRLAPGRRRDRIERRPTAPAPARPSHRLRNRSPGRPRRVARTRTPCMRASSRCRANTVPADSALGLVRLDPRAVFGAQHRQLHADAHVARRPASFISASASMPWKSLLLGARRPARASATTASGEYSAPNSVAGDEARVDVDVFGHAGPRVDER